MGRNSGRFWPKIIHSMNRIKKCCLLSLLSLFALLQAGCSDNITPDQPLVVIIKADDFNDYSTNWQRFIAILQQNDISAAAYWRIHTDNKGRKVTSSVVSTEGRGCCDGKKMLTITCSGNESGVYQAFTPPQNAQKIRVRACVRVKKGNVMLFVAKEGIANESASTGEYFNRWIILELETKGDILNNRVGIYNQALDGGEFEVDYVCVETIK